MDKVLLHSLLLQQMMRRLEEDQVRTLANSIELMTMHAFISLQTMNTFAPDDFLKNKLKVLGDYITHEMLKMPKKEAVA